ncbi:MAG: GerMN domain-containing protein, partial [Chloroflexi bacterium]|nr:GerMN domain-containing protein [Chloroflexota bacterium]
HGAGDRVVAAPADLDLGSPGECDAPVEADASETAEAGHPRGEALTVRLFFGHQRLNPGLADGRKVFPTERTVYETDDLAESVLLELFLGPTETERDEGYISTFSEATAGLLRRVRLVGGAAYVDLSDPHRVISNAATSCGREAFFAEVGETLRDALGVQRVLYALEGDPLAFYEWMQRGCDASNDACDPRPFVEE